MIFTETDLAGAYIVDVEFIEDARGFFARTWCRQEFQDVGLEPRVEQCNISFNRSKGTLRGMHYQTPPDQEVKLVRCTRGAIFDVMVDMRPEAETFKKWVGVELTEKNRRMLYVPRGFAHGYQTLEDNSEICYQVSDKYTPQSERGVRWDDPEIGVSWPIPDPIISLKDSQWPLL